MSIARGSRSYVNWKVEAAFDTVPSGNFTNIPLVSEGLGETINPIISASIQPDRTIPEARGGNIAVAGNFTTDFALVRYTTFLEHLLGGIDTASPAAPAAVASTTAYARGDLATSGGKTYRCIKAGTTSSSFSSELETDGTIFTSGTSQWVWISDVATTSVTTTITGTSALPSVGISLEKGVIGGDESQFTSFSGCRVDSLNLTIPQEGILQSVWNILAMRAIAQAASVSGTVQYPTDSAVVGFESAAEIINTDNSRDLVTVLKSGSLTIANNFETDNYRVGGRDRFDLVERRRNCSGEMEMYFQDLDMYNRFKLENTFGIRFSFYRGKQFMSITFPECKFFGSPSAVISGEGSIMSRFAFTPFRLAAAHDVQVILNVMA